MVMSRDGKQEPEVCDFCEEINRASAACPPDPNKPKVTNAGVVILGVAGTFFVGIYAATAPFLLPALRRICLPFVPATTTQVRNVFTALAGRSGSLIDIGSGDGRITLEAARRGFRAYGVELNTWLVLYSRLAAWRQGLHQSASFRKQDLWKTNLSSYDNIVIFGVEQMNLLALAQTVLPYVFPHPLWMKTMVHTVVYGVLHYSYGKELKETLGHLTQPSHLHHKDMQPFEVKLSQELSACSYVVACRFPLPSWEPVATIGSGVDTVWLYKVTPSKTR